MVALAMNVAAFLFLAAVAIVVIIVAAAFVVRLLPAPMDRGHDGLLLVSLFVLALMVFAFFIKG